MATRTTYLSLIKPDYVDDADVADINANMDTLDNAVHDVSEGMKFSGKTFTVGTASTCDFTTIQAAIDAIPVGTCRAILNIAVGNYPEDVVVRDKGLETLSLIGTNKDTTTIKSLSIEGNLRCVIDKLGFYGLSANKRTIDVNGACYFEMTASNLIGSNVADSIGVSIHGGSGLIHNCSITKYTNGILSAYGATMFAYSIQGSNNTHDLYANGGLIVTDNNTTLSRFSEYGGAVICKALGASLTAGVADSTTDATDSSKKLATTEWINNQVVESGQYWRKFADGTYEQWGIAFHAQTVTYACPLVEAPSINCTHYTNNDTPCSIVVRNFENKLSFDAIVWNMITNNWFDQATVSFTIKGRWKL